MSTAELLEQCRSKIPEPSKSNYEDDVKMILKGMGIGACESGSVSGCVSAQIGWSLISASACTGAEYSKSCESIVANFKKTRIAKESLTCLITTRMNKSTTQTVSSNQINITAGNLKCCTCESSGCMKVNPEGKLVPYNCVGIGQIDQKNSVDVHSTTAFTAEDVVSIESFVKTAIADDMKSSIESNKEGIGMDSGTKTINVSDIEETVKDENIQLQSSINEALSQLTAENIINFNLGNMESSGSCFQGASQENIVKHTVDTIMSSTFDLFKQNTSESDFKSLVDIMSKKELKGTDIVKGSRASEASSTAIIAVVVIVIVLAVIGYLYQKQGGGSGIGGFGAGSSSSMKIYLYLFLFIAILITAIVLYYKYA